MPAVKAKTRAQLALRATTKLRPDEAIEIIKTATGDAKGGGKGLLTSGIANLGATVHVERQSGNRLELSITSGKRIVELCTFTAETTAGDGGTQLRVGPLARYKRQQSRALGIIPIGPSSILGFDLYKRFLDQVQRQLMAADPAASVTIALPGA